MTYMNVKNSTPTRKWMQIVCLAGATWLMATGLASAQPSAQIGSQASMFNQVRTWLSETHKVKKTVRVRCVDPVWQIYLQVSMPLASNTAPTAASNAVALNSSAAPKTVVVPKRLIQRGTVIEADMLEEVSQQGGNTDSSLLQSTKDALAAEAVRDLSAGQALRVSDIRRAILVKQGQLVTMTVGDKSGFLITVRVEALQDGRMGEQVKLKNTESGRQISGIVTGPNLVKGVQ